MANAVTKSRRLPSGVTFTYVIGASGHGIKVGYSRDPKRRVSDMQVGSPVKMWVSHTWRLVDAEAKALEKNLHRLFSWAQKHGEWFDALSGEIIAVGNLLVDGRLADAERLIELIRERRALEAEIERCRFAWRYAPGKTSVERSAFEKREKARLPDLYCRHDVNELAALELGLWSGPDLKTIGGRMAVSRLRERIEAGAEAA